MVGEKRIIVRGQILGQVRSGNRRVEQVRQPAGSGNYGLNDATKEIHDVKKIFNVFAFSIDAKGDYLDKLYDKNWILTKSSDKTDLGDKLIKFCRLVVKEFFR